MTIWCCPNCREVLEQDNSRWYCVNGHSFDRAKQGYVNLLLANQKNSKDPGDNRAMVLGRRDFLQRGLYQPLVQAMAELLAAELEPSSRPLIQHTTASFPQFGSHSDVEPSTEPFTLLDLGCGEGYYLKALSQAIPTIIGAATRIHGLDISREAVKLAAASLPHGQFCVASSYRAPVADASVGLVLQIFAPVNESEILRILQPHGIWLRVSPGPCHLYQLKGALYEQVQEHEEPGVPGGFQELASTRVRFPVTLEGSNAIGQLLAMTPFSWHGSRTGREALLALDSFETETDFVVQLLSVNKTSAVSETFESKTVAETTPGEDAHVQN